MKATVARSFFVDDERYGLETQKVPSADWNPPLFVRPTVVGVLRIREPTERILS